MVPVVFVNEKATLPADLGGVKEAPNESFVFSATKKVALLGGHWANINSFVGKGTFGYVLLAQKSSFQNTGGVSGRQIVLKVDHQKRFVVWEVAIQARVCVNSIHQGSF